MTQIIYGDVLFIVNFSMDFLALFVTGKVLRRRIHPLALSVAAGLGAAYAVAILFFAGEPRVQTCISVAVSLLMCFIAYGGPARPFVQCSLLFYLVNFLMAGGITALYRLLNRCLHPESHYINGRIGDYQSEIPLVWFAVLAAVSAFGSYLWGRISRHNGRKKSSTLTLSFDGKKVTVRCLSDSGDLLTEPMSGLPVAIVRGARLGTLLPKELLEVLCRRLPEGIAALDAELARRVRMIPYTAVGKRGLLYGFMPDLAQVDGCEVRLCVAIGDTEEGEEAFGGYDGILPQL